MIRSKYKKMLAAAMAVLLVSVIAAVSIFSVSAVDDRKGSVEVKALPQYVGLPLEIIKIGDYKNGEISLYDDFKSFDIKVSDFSQNSILKDKLDKITEFVRESDIEFDGGVERIGYDGCAKFSGLDLDKLYVIIQPVYTKVVDVSPILVFLPANDDNGNVMYDVHIDAKLINHGTDENCGAVVVNKVDEEEDPLEGAAFSLWRKVYYTDENNLPDDKDTYELGKDDQGTFYWQKVGDKLLETNKNGQAVIDGLFVSYEYRLIEEEAPDGYILDDTPHVFQIVNTAVVKIENNVAVTEDGEPVVLTVVNKPHGGILDQSSDESNDQPSGSDASAGESSVEKKPSYPTPSQAVSIVSTVVQDGKVTVELTGDDVVKYIVIPAVVAASLVLVIILFVAGRKKNDDDNIEK